MSVEIIPRESEEQWLAERMTRITATDIGRLANGGPSVFAAVKAEKHGVRSFFGNRYTEWGHEREPLIVSHLEFEYDLVANDALYVNGGRAATPDAVANGLLGEVKTTVTDWWQGDDASTILELRRVKPQYLDQSLWAQDVAEVDRTVFGRQLRHHGEDGGADLRQFGVWTHDDADCSGHASVRNPRRAGCARRRSPVGARRAGR